MNENTNTQQEYAGFWIRTAATLIDWLILIIVTYPILYLAYGSSYWDLDPDLPFFRGTVDFLATIVLPFLYTVLFWMYRSATPGKIVLKLKILDSRSGQRLSPMQSVLRYLGYFISAIPLALGFIWVGWDAKKQSWHDKLTSTVVVRQQQTPGDQFEA